MSYPRIISKVFHSPWAIDRAMLGSILGVLATRLADDQAAQMSPFMAAAGQPEGLPANTPGAYTRGQRASSGVQLQRWGVDRFGDVVNYNQRAHAEGLKAHYAGGSYAATYQAQLASAPEGQIAVIFGSGILGKHLDAMEEICTGGLSVDKIQQAIAEAGNDEKIAAIVLHLDSPGGIVYGLPETCSLIRGAAAGKTIVGFCDSRSASAAYWILAACDHIYITPSSDVGSIGIYSAIIDCSEQLKNLGISIELITDGGKYKGAGAFNLPMTDTQKAKVQADVTMFSVMFKGYIRDRRAGISDETMQGQCFTGQQALDAKLADSLVDSLDVVIADLVAG